MPFSRLPLKFVFLLCIFVAAGCVEDRDYGEASNLRPDVNRNVDVKSNGNVADDSEETLDRLVNLPYEPVENVFRQENVIPVGNSKPVTDSADKRLTVVLRFSPEDTKSLVEKASKRKEPFSTEIEPEPWFPEELKAKSETSGKQQLKGIGFSADDFAKSPWLSGTLVKIEETDYFVLLLQTS